MFIRTLASSCLIAAFASLLSGQERIDWRAYQSPVKNQGGRGTCTAFAVAATLENFPGIPLDASEQFLYALAKDQQTQRAQLYAAYYNRRSELKPLFTDGLTLKEYVETLRMYGACEERFFPYRPKKLVVGPKLAALLIDEDSLPLGQMVYNRTQFTSAYREKLKLLGKVTGTGLEFIDFASVRYDSSKTIPQRAALLDRDSQRLVAWLRDRKLGHQSIPISYVISRKAWSKYAGKKDIPVFRPSDFPKTNKDAAGHAVTLVGWSPSLHGYVEGAPKKDKSGYYLFKNSWGTDWGGLGGYGLVRSDLHRMTVKQALLIGGVERRKSSEVHSVFDQVLMSKGEWRLKIQVVQQGKRDVIALSCYASNLRDPNLPAVRYVVKMRGIGDDKELRVVSPLIRRSAQPGYTWALPYDLDKIPSLEIALVHHREILGKPEPTSGLRYRTVMFRSVSRASDLVPLKDARLNREQARLVLAGE